MKKLLAIIVLVFAISPALAAGSLPLFAPPMPNFTLNGGLPKWKICRAKVQANTGNCTVLIIGESTPRGWGAMYNGTANDAASGAWPVQVAAQLRIIYGFNAQANSIAGSGNVGAIAAFTAYDTRVVSAGGWTIPSADSCLTAANMGPGGCAFQSSDTTAFQFNPKNTTTYPSAPIIPTDTIDMYTVNVNLGVGFGTLQAKVNGGSVLCSVPQNGGGALTFTKTTCTTGIAAADNTWQLSCSSCGLGTVFTGFTVRNSAVSEASFIDMGVGAAKVGDWNQSVHVSNPIPAIQKVYQPDLCIIQDTGNDMGTAQVSGAANNGSGLIRLTVNSSVNLATGQSELVSGVAGTTEANGTWTITVVDGTHIDLQGSAFSHAYTSGGNVGTSIASYKTNYQAIVTACQVTGDVLIVTSHPGPPGGYDVQLTYTVAQQQVATAANAPILDWWTTMCGTVSGTGGSSTCSRGGWQAGMANGWNASCCGAVADVSHQGPYAYAVLASQVAMILMGP